MPEASFSFDRLIADCKRFPTGVASGMTLCLVMIHSFKNPTWINRNQKRSLTEWNSHGKNFHEFISVRVPFREPDFLLFLQRFHL
jgi:hypothetical protein